MNLGRAKAKLDDGYCIWVGAGVTKQLWQGALQWDELTKNIEVHAGLAEGRSSQFPERLQRCADKLGPDVFRRHLCKIYYTDLCEAMLRRVTQSMNDEDGIPPEVRKVAALGQLANPIVSFNIEPFSSTLLARPAGPARIIPFIKAETPRIDFTEFAKTFQRIVYHPHGLSTADCIMTSEDYKTLDSTLAFRLAAHAAFKNNLAIVGMSLQDGYLREQISEFRSQINSIVWFNSQFHNLETWAMCNRVEMVQVEWGDFWEHWNITQIPEEGLMIAWYRVVLEAADELSGGTAYQIAQSCSDAWLREVTLADSVRIGEPGQLRLVDGQYPSDILGKLKELLQSKAIRVPPSMHRPRGMRA
jgi:SIR2-like protein